MTRRFLLSTAAILILFAAEGIATAQVIIIPGDPLKERDEYSSRVVNEWFQLYLGRKPTEKEHAQTMQKLRLGTSIIAVQANIIASDEYFKKHGGNAQGYIQGIFSDVVGRKPNPTEVLVLQPQVNLNRFKVAVDILTKVQGPPNPFARTIP